MKHYCETEMVHGYGIEAVRHREIEIEQIRPCPSACARRYRNDWRQKDVRSAETSAIESLPAFDTWVADGTWGMQDGSNLDPSSDPH